MAVMAPKNVGKSRAEIMAATIAQIQKEMPDEIFGRYSEIGSTVDINTISTGSLAVDNAIGGGLARKKIVELVGATSSGKTTLALTAIAHLQKENPDANCMYLDAEQALDPSYAEVLGVDMSKLILMQPSCGENGFKAAETFMASGVADLVVVDSVAAMLPLSMIERDYNQEAQPGQFAKLISTAIPRLNRQANLTGCTVILINQWKPVVRMNQYQAVAGSMGNWYQPGGGQLPFFCSQILEIKKKSEIKVGNDVVSNVCTMTCKKNKIAPPYRSADFVITFGKGLDREQELVGLGLSLGVIEQLGSFYYMKEVVGNDMPGIRGRSGLSDFLNSNPEATNKLEAIIKSKIGGSRKVSIDSLGVNEDGTDPMTDPSPDVPAPVAPVRRRTRAAAKPVAAVTRSSRDDEAEFPDLE